MATQPVVRSQYVTKRATRAQRSHAALRLEKSTRRAPSPRSRIAPLASAEHPHHEHDDIVVKFMPLVKRVAFQMREHLPAHVDVDDLIGAGLMGLLDAIRKFKSAKHVKLESYARHRIRGAIIDGLRTLDTASRDMRKKNKKTEKTYRELQVRLGRPVTDEEMAEALGINLKKWYRTVQELQPLGVEWLRPKEIDEKQVPDIENLASPQDEQESPFELCYRREQRDLINRAMTSLSERDRRIMSFYYENDLTMKEIGARLGVDESRVSQLHSAALARLRSRITLLLRPSAHARTMTPPAYVAAGVSSGIETGSWDGR